MDVNTIANNKLKNVATAELVDLKSFWQEKTSVVIFFRRWGCLFCRIWAKEVSKIIPYLRTKDVQVVGVGVEEFGAQEFRDEKFFDGDIFVDQSYNTYKSLGFVRYNFFSIIASLFWKESRSMIARGRRDGITGNMKGDALQNGGALIVDKSGNLLKHYIQVGPADYLSNEDILKILGLEQDYKNSQEGKKNEADAKENKGVPKENLECNLK